VGYGHRYRLPVGAFDLDAACGRAWASRVAAMVKKGIRIVEVQYT
jgi:hypothetical protein